MKKSPKVSKSPKPDCMVGPTKVLSNGALGGLVEHKKKDGTWGLRFKIFSGPTKSPKKSPKKSAKKSPKKVSRVKSFFKNLVRRSKKSPRKSPKK